MDTVARPELLAPAGHVEALYAAIEGGADAVYFGLDRFSARNRAKNFHLGQLQSLKDTAAKHSLKLYLALNTLVKNNEIPTLLDRLQVASDLEVDAVIFQDWGVYHLARQHFPGLTLHGSTQLSIHNSAAALHAERAGIKRLILARELTLDEIRAIRASTKAELEVFAHGALCYSLPGNCLFSSFLGGMSANRGACRQPCRRLFQHGRRKGHVFNLRDLELIDSIPVLAEAGIHSVKIEGRMKSAEYVYAVTRAYRMVLDDPAALPEAKQLLVEDMGREKTTWFFGKKISASMAEHPYAGICIGTIASTGTHSIVLSSNTPLARGNRLRILPASGRDAQAFKIDAMRVAEEEVIQAPAAVPVEIITETAGLAPGDAVFLTGKGAVKFPAKLPIKRWPGDIHYAKSSSVLAQLTEGRQLSAKPQYIFRINTLAWLPKLYFSSAAMVILDFSFREWANFDPSRPLIQKNAAKIAASLPLFISEKRIADYITLTARLIMQGIRTFVVQQPGQRSIIEAAGAKAGKNVHVNIWAGEHVYSLNAAAEAFLGAEKFAKHILPFENDLDNMLASARRNAIVPLYFRPPLFYSRMPVTARELSDADSQYAIHKSNGMTIVVPDKPVAWCEQRRLFSEKGFSHFLIDVSFEKPSSNTFNRLLKKARESAKEQPAFQFNLKRGLD